MFKTSSIIDNLNHSEGLEYKKLCRSLKITKKPDKEKLDIALTALEKLEIINKNANNIYSCTKGSGHIVAKIRCSSKGFCFAVRGKDKEDIYIKENLLNYAWNVVQNQFVLKINNIFSPTAGYYDLGKKV